MFNEPMAEDLTEEFTRAIHRHPNFPKSVPVQLSLLKERMGRLLYAMGDKKHPILQAVEIPKNALAIAVIALRIFESHQPQD